MERMSVLILLLALCVIEIESKPYRQKQGSDINGIHTLNGVWKKVLDSAEKIDKKEWDAEGVEEDVNAEIGTTPWQ